MRISISLLNKQKTFFIQPNNPKINHACCPVVFKLISRALSLFYRLHHQRQRAKRSLQSPQKLPPLRYHLKSALALCPLRPALPPCLTWTSSIQTPSLTVSPHQHLVLKFTNKFVCEEIRYVWKNLIYLNLICFTDLIVFIAPLESVFNQLCTYLWK